MTVAWRHYRYSPQTNRCSDRSREWSGRFETTLYQIPKIGSPKSNRNFRARHHRIVSHDGGLYSTSHVGLALRTPDGILRFLHASAPHNYGKVVVDSRLSDYVKKYRNDSGSWSRGRCGKSAPIIFASSKLRRPPAKIDIH